MLNNIMNMKRSSSFHNITIPGCTIPTCEGKKIDPLALDKARFTVKYLRHFPSKSMNSARWVRKMYNPSHNLKNIQTVTWLRKDNHIICWAGKRTMCSCSTSTHIIYRYCVITPARNKKYYISQVSKQINSISILKNLYHTSRKIIID